MYQNDWIHILRKLNPKLKVAWLSKTNLPPGIYYLSQKGMEYNPVCATDVGYIKEHSEFDTVGHRIHTGWRFVVWTLLHLKLTTREKVRAIWPGFFEVVYQNPIRLLPK